MFKHVIICTSLILKFQLKHLNFASLVLLVLFISTFPKTTPSYSWVRETLKVLVFPLNFNSLGEQVVTIYALSKFVKNFGPWEVVNFTVIASIFLITCRCKRL